MDSYYKKLKIRKKVFTEPKFDERKVKTKPNMTNRAIPNNKSPLKSKYITPFSIFKSVSAFSVKSNNNNNNNNNNQQPSRTESLALPPRNGSIKSDKSNKSSEKITKIITTNKRKVRRNTPNNKKSDRKIRMSDISNSNDQMSVSNFTSSHGGSSSGLDSSNKKLKIAAPEQNQNYNQNQNQNTNTNPDQEQIYEEFQSPPNPASRTNSQKIIKSVSRSSTGHKIIIKKVVSVQKREINEVSSSSSSSSSEDGSSSSSSSSDSSSDSDDESSSSSSGSSSSSVSSSTSSESPIINDPREETLYDDPQQLLNQSKPNPITRSKPINPDFDSMIDDRDREPIYDEIRNFQSNILNKNDVDENENDGGLTSVTNTNVLPSGRNSEIKQNTNIHRQNSTGNRFHPQVSVHKPENIESSLSNELLRGVVAFVLSCLVFFSFINFRQS